VLQVEAFIQASSGEGDDVIGLPRIFPAIKTSPFMTALSGKCTLKSSPYTPYFVAFLCAVLHGVKMSYPPGLCLHACINTRLHENPLLLSPMRLNNWSVKACCQGLDTVHDTVQGGDRVAE
jgi:hypothetical protein